MNAWHIAGRHFAAPPPPDWRQRLASRLGERPRRVGSWVELALYGALACLEDAGETRLPDAALLTLSTLHGPDIALRAALAEAADGLPLPIGFLVSQPGQVLPALAHYLQWHGDARCLSTRQPQTALHLACLEAGAAGLLAGWVDEDTPGRSTWLRLVPATAPAGLQAAGFAQLADPANRFLSFTAGVLHVAPHSPESPHG
jgi:hypothetical protein